ncbi:MAG: sugar ABC transporter permease [Betaproteobacteria bacterium]|jgi:multiple sugar transport system permease protein|nr:sugar ABC transporter permease [Betaproteobacteria bacterium]
MKAQRAASLHGLMLPAVIFVVLMVIFPFGYAFWLSLQDYRIGQAVKFIGIGNYTALIQDEQFWNGIKLTFILYITALILQLILGVGLGMLLHRVQLMRGLVRTVMVSPFMLPPVVIGMMSIVILDPGMGVANYLLKAANLPTSLFLASTDYVIYTVVLIDTWQWTPFVALIVLGGLQSLPTKIYEAAAIDGATGWREFIYITLPLLGPTILTAAVLRSVDLLRFFDVIYITTQGGPGYASSTLNIYAYRKAFEFTDIGYAAALMITLSTIVFGVVLVFSQFRKKVTW